MNRTPNQAARRKRLMLRAAPLAIAAIAAFVVGVAVSSESGERDAVARFGTALAAGDYAAMAAELTPASQGDYDAEALEKAYGKAQQIATATSISVGEARGSTDAGGDSVVALPVSVETTAFGTIEGELAVPVADGAIQWQPNLVFPGLNEGEGLDRKTRLPERAPLLAADRTPLAEGPADARTTNGTGGVVTGEVGEPTKAQAKELEARGFPKGSLAGTSGLELAFDEALAGTPGGELVATGEGESRVLASSEPIPGKPVRTTLDLDLQNAATSALGDTFGGAAVLDARNGNVLALAGIAFSAPQPPGSTFKVITVTGALQAEITEPSEEFPVVSTTVAGGREIANAYDELCGGTLVASFAHSCNTVFAPLGVELGGEELVETTELFGFNEPPSLYNQEAIERVKPPESTIPEDLGDEVNVAVSALGQGEVLATPLVMASVSQVIANGGVRSPTSIVRNPALAGDYPDVKVTTPQVAEQVKKMMIEVVNDGTGGAASLPDAQVAGKTGTAELGTIDPDAPLVEGEEPQQEVDAWFTAFAPAGKPKLAVAVLVVQADGDGGAIAAPIARTILDAGL